MDNNILAGAALETEFARDNGISPRTCARYRKQTDGLPHFMFGGKVYIPLAEARAWLTGKVKRPNPRRKSA